MAGRDFNTLGVFVRPVMGDFVTLRIGPGRDCAIEWPSFCHVGPGCRWPPVYGCLSGLWTGGDVLLCCLYLTTHYNTLGCSLNIFRGFIKTDQQVELSRYINLCPMRYGIRSFSSIIHINGEKGFLLGLKCKDGFQKVPVLSVWCWSNNTDHPTWSYPLFWIIINCRLLFNLLKFKYALAIFWKVSGIVWLPNSFLPWKQIIEVTRMLDVLQIS